MREKDKRRYAAVETAKLGHGGIDYIAQLLGCDPKTIHQGQVDLADLPDVPPERSRKKGVDADAASIRIINGKQTSTASLKSTPLASP